VGVTPADFETDIQTGEEMADAQATPDLGAEAGLAPGSQPAAGITPPGPTPAV
jgi:hypothetical protein